MLCPAHTRSGIPCHPIGRPTAKAAGFAHSLEASGFATNRRDVRIEESLFDVTSAADQPSAFPAWTTSNAMLPIGGRCTR